VRGLAALLSGILFGAGLAVSQMTNPAKVQAFLDVAGAWDPSLAFVMGAALAVSSLGVALARRRPQSLLGEPLQFPSATALDLPLIAGAALFGVGWGLGGFCPGPALAGLATGVPAVWVFTASMLAGVWSYRWIRRVAPGREHRG
jgi:uncharacterized membrane protein YedE/YeeE